MISVTYDFIFVGHLIQFFISLCKYIENVFSNYPPLLSQLENERNLCTVGDAEI